MTSGSLRDSVFSVAYRIQTEDAAADFESMPPDDQWLYKTAQKINIAFDDLKGNHKPSKQEIATQILSVQVGEKFAKWMLAKPRFREFLGI